MAADQPGRPPAGPAEGTVAGGASWAGSVSMSTPTEPKKLTFSLCAGEMRARTAPWGAHDAGFRAAAGDGPVARDVPGESAGGTEVEILARGRWPGLPPRFARVLGRQVAADEPVTVQRRNPAQRAGGG
jgi:hypothetical protein